MELNLNTKDTVIRIIINGYFNIPKNVDDELKNNFLEISAPAIVYPYVRTFISEVTAFDNGETVILPIINFAELDCKKDDE